MLKLQVCLFYISEERKAEAAHLSEQCPDRVPVIIEKAKHSDHVPELVKNKLLVPGTCTVGQFVHLIRRNMKLDPTRAIFMFVNDTLPPVASLMSSLYEENKEEDGFVYMVYSGENVFGRHSETLE